MLTARRVARAQLGQGLQRRDLVGRAAGEVLRRLPALLRVAALARERLGRLSDRRAALVRELAAARAALESPDRRRWYEVPVSEIDDDLAVRLREEAGDHSLYRGGRNPLAPPLRVSTGVDSDGEPVVVGEVRLDRSREGPPARAHGGLVAGIFDDVLSGVPWLVDAGPMVTGRLSIRYRRPTPLDVDLRFLSLIHI